MTNASSHLFSGHIAHQGANEHPAVLRQYLQAVQHLDAAAGAPIPNNFVPAAKACPLPRAASRPKRKIYVLHSGMNDPENVAATGLRNGLLARGVALQDMIVLPNPYPAFSEGLSAASQNLRLYEHSANPQSQMVGNAQGHLLSQLQERGITPDDELVWVGHSAGGQLGLSLASRLATESPYRLQDVITLGTPVCSNHAPRETRVRQYVSPADGVLVGTNQLPLSDNLRAEAFSSVMDSNDRVRVFSNVNHSGWYQRPEVMDRILQEKPDPDAAPSNTNQPRTWWQGLWHNINRFVGGLFGFSLE